MRRKTITIDLDDALKLDELGEDFARNVSNGLKTYMELFYNAIDSLLPSVATMVRKVDILLI
jgi:hypothetical protein